MEGKFSHKLEVLLPWILPNINFLKENWQYPHACWENFGAKIFSKLLLGQCGVTDGGFFLRDLFAACFVLL
jgi:hypothetical protein